MLIFIVDIFNLSWMVVGILRRIDIQLTHFSFTFNKYLLNSCSVKNTRYLRLYKHELDKDPSLKSV